MRIIFAGCMLLLSQFAMAQMNALDDSCKLTPVLVPIKVNGKWGYINQKMQVRIKPQFDDAQPFANLYYAEKIKSSGQNFATVKKNGKLFRIDTLGKVINQIDSAKIYDDDISYIPEEHYRIEKVGELFGVKAIATSQWVLQPLYEEIIPFDPSFTLAVPYQVKKNGKYGIARQDGKIVVPIIYDKIESKGLYWKQVRLLWVTKDTASFYIDYCGKEFSLINK